MNVINLFGAPGAGKSTTAAGLFNLMKLKGYKVELVLEYAKDLVYEERLDATDQFYIFTKQRKRLMRLNNKVDYVVTDSPLLLSLLYAPEDYPEEFKLLVKYFNNEFNNLYFYINRVKAYARYGRKHTEEESDALGKKLLSILIKEDLPLIRINGDEDAPFKIYNQIKIISGE